MATMDSGKGKIMIVDDEESVRDLLSALLKKANYNPIEAEDGMQAIKLLQADGNMSNVAVILCDLNMPNVDGLGAIEFFKKEAPGIPIIVVSGSSDVTLVSSVLKKLESSLLILEYLISSRLRSGFIFLISSL